MTREEAITVLKALSDNPLFSDQHRAAFSIAIHDIKVHHDWDINNLILINKDNYEPIEQEPCEDAVSRKAVLGMAKSYNTDGWDMYIPLVVDAEDIEELPPVIPQEPKTGHWIPTYGNVKCSVCGSVKDSRDVGKATHYCDFCGAKMVEPQESEET